MNEERWSLDIKYSLSQSKIVTLLGLSTYQLARPANVSTCSAGQPISLLGRSTYQLPRSINVSACSASLPIKWLGRSTYQVARIDCQWIGQSIRQFGQSAYQVAWLCRNRWHSDV